MFGYVKEITKEIAEAAAKWWADQISGNVTFDNGDDSLTGSMCSAMASKLVKPVTEEQKNKFIEILTERIVTEQRDILSVDYGPDMLLGESAEQAGISESNFPWKTVMWIVMEKDTGMAKVIVRAGYRAEQKQIYPLQDGEPDGKA